MRPSRSAVDARFAWLARFLLAVVVEPVELMSLRSLVRFRSELRPDRDRRAGSSGGNDGCPFGDGRQAAGIKTAQSFSYGPCHREVLAARRAGVASPATRDARRSLLLDRFG